MWSCLPDPKLNVSLYAMHADETWQTVSRFAFVLAQTRQVPGSAGKVALPLGSSVSVT